MGETVLVPEVNLPMGPSLSAAASVWGDGGPHDLLRSGVLLVVKAQMPYVSLLNF